ncbi:MAG: hypothetical protein DRJ09_00205 [Bacteroidetes bacterium]|nr:MAG: hypothetical protein DRJ09_00205 [Bacteroidota bacterium]
MEINRIRIPAPLHGSIIKRLSYLHNHPIELGIVLRAEDYVYSSAIDYPLPLSRPRLQRGYKSCPPNLK